MNENDTQEPENLPVSSRHKKRLRKQQETTRTSDRAASYARYSSAHQREESIGDQQRKCREAATTNGHHIPVELEFADEAVSGTKRSRRGLDSLLAAAEDHEFDTLYVHSLSRLARESVITMPLLKRLVHVHGIRFISTSEGVDSERDGWEMIASLLSVLHERYNKELAANVLRGQEGTILEGYSVGDWCFGYGSEPIPESENARKGRNAKPRMNYVIDDIAASWVVRIFEWYVIEQRSIRWIVRELNRRNAPKDHRSSSQEWHHSLVVNVLAREKYIGIWPWGERRSVRDPETGIVRQEDRPEDECRGWTRELPHLRIIDDDLFAGAQKRLEANALKWNDNRKENGQFNGSPKGSGGRSNIRLLHGLLTCQACGSPFQYCGKRIKCRGHARGTCDVKTTLASRLAERLVLTEIGHLVLEQNEWFEVVFQELTESYNNFESRVPTTLANKQKELADVKRRIERLVDSVESDSAPAELKTRLKKRQEERSQLEREIRRLKREIQSSAGKPTREWLKEQLKNLGAVLHGSTPAANSALSALIGGEMLLEEVPIPGRKSKMLRGTCQLTVGGIYESLAPQVSTSSDDSRKDGLVEIVIDFMDREAIDAQRNQAKELYDRGLMNCEIAKSLGVNRSRVTALLKEWFTQHGEEMPDGRARRSTLDKKHSEPPLYQKAAESVMSLFEQGKLLGEIANALSIDRNTVTKAIKFWHESRGLPVPDGRTRRKSLDKKSA